MGNTVEVNDLLIKAKDVGAMQSALIIGTEESGKMHIYSHTADREVLLALLDKAREKLSNG